MMENGRDPGKKGGRAPVVAACCAGALVSLAVMETAWGAHAASWVVMEALPFAAFWFFASLAVLLTWRLARRALALESRRSRVEAAREIGLLLASLAFVAIYAYLVIVPVVGAPNVDQTGAGSLWLACSMIAIPIALPLAAFVVD